MSQYPPPRTNFQSLNFDGWLRTPVSGRLHRADAEPGAVILGSTGGPVPFNFGGFTEIAGHVSDQFSAR